MNDAIPPAYRVLARKYRPQSFTGLIGQEALVRTLKNAIAQGRLAHAFLLTGVRGVGKTTTARILARALNCIGPDGQGGPTADPCGRCEHCVAISEDRHVDVIEMDAASRTGVGDIRELIEGVRYRPISARYKVYIIDEVHMLSTSAFNALLKTLEEPPEHVKFVFATTEIRKVPVTVLSRCQRFDLRRVEMGVLVAHLTDIAGREAIALAPEVAAMIARAAEGSVRDALSLLDQAVAHGGQSPAPDSVREMLGLADRMRLFDLAAATFSGRVADALGVLRSLYEAGADPVAVLQDLLDIAHQITRVKLVPAAAEDASLPEAERARTRTLAEALAVPVLARGWSLLLKGVQETAQAPDGLAAAEMVVVRLAYMADVPTPAELVRAASDGSRGAARGGDAAPSRPAPAAAPAAPIELAPKAHAPANGGAAMPASFREAVALFSDRREPRLYAHLVNDVQLVQFAPGAIKLHLAPSAPRDLTQRAARLLSTWTGRPWTVEPSDAFGEPTLAEQRKTAEAKRRQEVAQHPLVQAALAAFPGAEISNVRDRPLAASDPGEEP